MYQVTTLWELPWESDSIFCHKENILTALDNDPEIISSMEEENRTIEDYIEFGWITIKEIVN